MKTHDVAGRPSRVRAEGIQPVATEERKTSDECAVRGVINRFGSYQQAPASSPKKAEGKRGIPPLTPYGEKGRVKKQDGGSFGTLQDRAGAGTRVRGALLRRRRCGIGIT